MAEELLEKIPAEKRWAMTAKVLTGFNLLRIALIRSLMGKGEGIFAPVMGWEKYEEISTKTWGEGGKRIFPWFKETFNIPVEDAIGAAKLYIVTCFLTAGPEDKFEMAEETPERACFIVLGARGCKWPRLLCRHRLAAGA